MVITLQLNLQRGFWLGLVLWGITGSVSAQTPVVGPLVKVAWDYSAQDLTNFLVERFEVCVDGVAETTCRGVGIPAEFSDTQTQPGYHSYAADLPALMQGPHTVAVRACSAAGCGDASASVAFTVVILPRAPLNPRLVVR